MADVLDEPEFNDFVRQQTQAPAGVPGRSRRTGQRGNLSSGRPVNGWWLARAWFITERCRKPIAQVAPFDVKHRCDAEVQNVSNRCWMHAAMQQIKDTCARECSCGGGATPEEAAYRAQLVVG